MNAVKVAAWCAGVSVGLCGILGAYVAHGQPVGSSPVVLSVPDAVMDVVCSPTAIGCYLSGLPDFVWLGPDADDATLGHEMLHYLHPQWSECEVSEHLYSTTGLKDAYNRSGFCE